MQVNDLGNFKKLIGENKELLNCSMRSMIRVLCLEEYVKEMIEFFSSSTYGNNYQNGVGICFRKVCAFLPWVAFGSASS